MTSKKQTILITLLCLFAFTGMSQVKVGTGSYDINDSSLYPAKRLPQHNEFLQNNYAYPAKPRNMWELGIKGGLFTVSGDVPVRLFTPGFAVHVRKSLGYIFSLRLEYMYGIGKGLHWLDARNYAKNPAWRNAGYDANRVFIGTNLGGGNFDQFMHQGTDRVFYNYKTNVQDLGLQGIVTLNNVRFHKRKTSAVIYGIAGIGASVYETKVDALNASGAKYNFNASNFTGGTNSNRKTILNDLKDLLDGEYETLAENHGPRRPKLFGKTLKPSGTVGVGVAFKLGKRINLAIEDRHTFIKDDLLDGQRWQEHPSGDASMTRDFDSYNMLSVGLNFNIGAKSVEPLWWLNPLDYVYSDLPGRVISRFKYTPKDDDKDGVINEMDLEQNTPEGCPVNTHGVTADTDGDGVPDCKDKELITPTACQPVDADGIGKCPEVRPACCDDIKPPPPPKECNPDLAIDFGASSKTLSADNKASLDELVAMLKASPDCNICFTIKKKESRPWALVNVVRNYLISKGITEDRMGYNADMDQEMNTVNIGAGNENCSGF